MIARVKAWGYRHTTLIITVTVALIVIGSMSGMYSQNDLRGVTP